jgi:UTP--glucose-1-phosphate uridylyltransferase
MTARPDFLIIPAAGLGTRMRPVNPVLPKEMLTINGKPAIHYALAEGISIGIREIIIIINHGKDFVRRYFEEPRFREAAYPQAAAEMALFARECAIHFLYQEPPRGEADAIGLCHALVDDANLAIIYPDNLYAPPPGALLHLLPHFLNTDQDLIGLTEVSPQHQAGTSNAGRVDLQALDGDVFSIKRLLPKGAGPFAPRFPGELRACGIMLSSGARLFNCIEIARTTVKQGEFTDTPVRRQIMLHHCLLGCRLPGQVFDIGNPMGYALCRQYMTRQVR